MSCNRDHKKKNVVSILLLLMYYANRVGNNLVFGSKWVIKKSFWYLDQFDISLKNNCWTHDTFYGLPEIVPDYEINHSFVYEISY